MASPASSHNGSAAAAPSPQPLDWREWMRASSWSLPSDDYVARAAAVASALADRLVGSVDAAEDMEVSTPDGASTDLGGSTHGGSTHGGSTGSESSVARRREACRAFGGVLFEIFSRGETLSSLSSMELDADGGEEGEDPLFSDMLLEEVGLAPPAPKKPSSSGSGGDRGNCQAAKAKAFLRERGLPLSVCRLVSDLLEAEEWGEFVSDTVLISPEEARDDLARMRDNPDRFLWDRTCPERALVDTGLLGQSDSEIYGRESEMRDLMEIAGRVASHVLGPGGGDPGDGGRDGDNGRGGGRMNGAAKTDDFLCEAVFLSGHSGSGKSSVIRKLVGRCAPNGWCVLVCKFERRIAPLSSLLRSVDAFFGGFVDAPETRGDLPAGEAFDGISPESLEQLCALLPNLCKLFPAEMDRVQRTILGPDAADDASDDRRSGSSGAMGSGRNRLKYLFRTILGLICGGGRPLLLCLEDAHWADGAALDVVSDFVRGAALSAGGEAPRGGLLCVMSFRDNEAKAESPVMRQMECMELSKGNINVSRIALGELPEQALSRRLDKWNIHQMSKLDKNRAFDNYRVSGD